MMLPHVDFLLIVELPKLESTRPSDPGTPADNADGQGHRRLLSRTFRHRNGLGTYYQSPNGLDGGRPRDLSCTRKSRSLRLRRMGMHSSTPWFQKDNECGPGEVSYSRDLSGTPNKDSNTNNTLTAEWSSEARCSTQMDPQLHGPYNFPYLCQTTSHLLGEGMTRQPLI
jgi:hypothetical protein